MPKYCKSGKHYWLNEESREKCCNGYIKILTTEVTEHTSSVKGLYFKWVTPEEAQQPSEGVWAAV